MRLVEIDLSNRTIVRDEYRLKTVLTKRNIESERTKKTLEMDV